MRLWPFSSSACENGVKLRGMQRPHGAVAAGGDAVELIRGEGERDAVGAIDVAQRLEQRATEGRRARTGRPETAA